LEPKKCHNGGTWIPTFFVWTLKLKQELQLVEIRLTYKLLRVTQPWEITYMQNENVVLKKKIKIAKIKKRIMA
jgi:hypothetical protein